MIDKYIHRGRGSNKIYTILKQEIEFQQKISELRMLTNKSEDDIMELIKEPMMLYSAIDVLDNMIEMAKNGHGI